MRVAIFFPFALASVPVVGCVSEHPEVAEAQAAALLVGCDVSVPADYTTVQAAIDGALDGDRICVAAGAYYGPVRIENRRLTLVGEGSGTTILDGDGQDTTVVIVSSTVSLAGFAVVNGHGRRGGGIHGRAAFLDFDDLVVRDNTADLAGGGIHVEGTRLLATNLVLDANRAGTYGGGLYGEHAGLDLSNIEILGNHADQGGGISLREIPGGCLVTNLVVAGNVADSVGGLDLNGNQVAVHFDNIAIVGNTASDDFGAARVFGYGMRAELDNAVVSGNRALTGIVHGIRVEYQASAVMTYTNIWDNTGGRESTGSSGNIAVDPGFVSTAGPPESWDLHLAAGSAMIDAGDPAVLDPDGTRSDIGAYGGPEAQ